MVEFYFGVIIGSRYVSDERRRGPKPQVSDEELLAIFENSKDPVLTATEVAEHVSIARRSVYDRLRKLEDSGVLESKKVGGRTTVWWYPGFTETIDTNT